MEGSGVGWFSTSRVVWKGRSRDWKFIAYIIFIISLWSLWRTAFVILWQKWSTFNEGRTLKPILLFLSLLSLLWYSEFTISLKMTSYYSLILQVDPPEQEVDITQLSVIQSKRLEMELQIKVLSLETQLERQRQQLFELRKTQYAATGENFLLIFNHINL